MPIIDGRPVIWGIKATETKFISKPELCNLPIGTTVESFSGTRYRVQKLGRTHIELVRITPIPPVQGCPAIPLFERLTIKQALRFIVVSK